MRIWAQHVTRHITSWKPAEYGMWTLAATLLKVNWTEGDEFVLIFKSYLIYMFQSNKKISFQEVWLQHTRARLFFGHTTSLAMD